MPPHRTAAILSVGDELVLGQTLDTNSRWLSERLLAAGIMPLEHVTVPDDLEAHVAALRRLAATCDLIVSSGGLGPTDDDLTRHALARAMDDTLVQDPLALAQVEAWFTARGRPMPPINATQAQRPTRAISVQNLNGTAPGLFGSIKNHEKAACEVFCLPGPPGELMPMFEQQVLPRLRPDAGASIRTRAVPTFGIGESDLATRLGELMSRERNPLVGTTASGGMVTCRLRYSGPLSTMEADALMDTVEREVRARAAPYALEGHSLPEEVVSLLSARHESLGVVESCTAGLLAATIADVPGASNVLQGGLITYSNDFKQRFAGVHAATLAAHGAVSRETAIEMAVGGRTQLGVDHCLSITGVAGPGGGSTDKPVGTVWIALDSAAGGSPQARRFRFGGNRSAIRQLAAMSALGMLRLTIIGRPETLLLREVR